MDFKFSSAHTGTAEPKAGVELLHFRHNNSNKNIIRDTVNDDGVSYG